MINLTIDNKPVSVEPGATILEAAKACGVKIPYLCHYSKLKKPHGGCRICMVEVEGNPRLLAACTNPVAEGMKVITGSEKVHKARKFVLELLLSDHDARCITCEKDGDCKLQKLAYEYGVEEPRFTGARRNYGVRRDNPFLETDHDKCILCGRCVRVCEEIPAVAAIDFIKRGFATKVSPAYDKALNCVFCGECMYACPTGAINSKIGRYQGRTRDLKAVESVCPFCGCGCNYSLLVKNGRVVKVQPKKNSPVNDGSLCVKGSFGYDFIHHKDRLTTPLIKENGQFRPASWDEALGLVAEKFKVIQAKTGADSIGGFASARCTNEENYLFQKLMRAAVGTNNVDHCARLCHASTVAGLADSFGSGAMTNSIAEIANAKTILVTGSNTPETHPIIALQVFKAVRENGAKLIIADPRQLRFSPYAQVQMRHKPGTDIALFNGLMHVIIKEGLEDKDFIAQRTEGYEELKKVVERYTPEYVENITGVPQEQIIAAARLYATNKPASILYSMGITQHVTGTNGVKTIANLAMLTGNLGRESSGVNPLRGQNNVQGACDVGALPNVYPGYQKVADVAIRAKFEAAWGVKLPANNGLTITEMVKAAGNSLKALYVMGENPMLSDPDLTEVKKHLESLDFLVVQDIFMTETAELAHVVLPVASFAEKDGTFTNTERRVQLLHKAVDSPGEARTDWQILCDLSTRLGYNMSYDHPSQIMDEIASVTPIYGGISFERISKLGLQWPCPDKNHPGTKFLHKDKFSRGLGKFFPIEFQSPPEWPDAEYPLILTTGRVLFHFHTGSMSRRSKGLEEVCPKPYVEINPVDAVKLGISDGEMVKVGSRRGEIQLAAAVNDRCTPGVIFIPFHFKEAAANVLTIAALDPVAKIPEFKVCAARVEKA
ncbi:MAG: formate dehydrogenase subunit alpha [Candidatus Schekmanbacteria bacterium]|nr:formate dehydrogenase subunit alpha [Candidatus Schekmanbacteria bacterium]